MVISDIAPQAPVHLLVIVKEHIRHLSDFNKGNRHLILDIFDAIQTITQDLTSSGFRVVTNMGPDGGQAVDHLHFHVLGGRQMDWPPG